MLNLPPWDTNLTEGVCVLLLFLAGYCIYHFFAEGPRWRSFFEQRQGEVHEHALWSRYLGGLCIGVLPLVVLLVLFEQEPAVYGVKASFGWPAFGWVLGLALLIIPMNYFNSRKPRHLAVYPTVRRTQWTLPQLANYACSWICYLTGYELMFRGILLFGLLPVLGPWLAIALNVVLYVLVHLPKSIEESVGALPLGLLLCLITLSTGTIWVAVLVHITLALSNFFFSLHHHPTMTIKR
jgi:membrane protease YdiL (CAAX protease family)